MNVIWISFDSVRADHCSFEGYARDTMPFVQSWISKPLGFDQGWDVFRHRQETLSRPPEASPRR